MNKSKSLISLLWVLLVAFLPLAAHADDLAVTFAGERLTSSNAASVLKKNGGSGTLKYDAKKHILTMENVNLACKGYKRPLQTEGSGTFTLELKGNNVITTEISQVELGAEKNIITGKGASLKVTTSKHIPGIQVDDNELCIMGGCLVVAEGESGIAGDGMSMTTLRINGDDGTKVVAKGRDYPAVDDFGEIILENCTVTNPLGAKPDKVQSSSFQAICLNGEKVMGEVTIEKLAADYDIQVNGTQVSASNAADVLGDGKVSFDPATRILTLKSADIAATGKPAICSKSLMGIAVIGDCSLTSDVDALQVDENTAINGEGKLVISSTGGAAILAKSQLSISDIAVTASGLKGLWGQGEHATLRMNKAELKAKGSEGSVGGFTAISLDGCRLVAPNGAVNNNGQIEVNGALCTEEVVINKTVYYPLYIFGKQVSSENYADVMGDGTVKFDSDNHILTLNGFKGETQDFTQGISVFSDMDFITIDVHGENSIFTPYFGIFLSAKTTITGDGKLSVNSNSSSMVVNGVLLTVEKGPQIILKGDNGMSGFTDAMGEVKLVGAAMSITGGVVKLASFDLFDCTVVQPEGYSFVDGKIMVGDKFYVDEIIVKPNNSSGIGNATQGHMQVGANPAIDFISISQAVPGTKLALYAVDGRCVYSGVADAAGCARISVQHLTAGHYLLRAGQVTRHIVVK